MRRELREEIDGIARRLMQNGEAKTWPAAKRAADALTRCGARTRAGKPCHCRGLGKGGRCKFHGGASTGPRTAEGLVRSLAAARAGFQRWRAVQKGQAAAPPPQAPAPRTLDIQDWPEGDCTFEAAWPDGFKVQVQITRDTAVLSADVWVETINLTADGKRFVCNGCERPTPTLQEGPEEFLCGKCTAGA